MKTLPASFIVLLLMTMAVDMALAAPPAIHAGDEDFLDRYDRSRREARLDSLTNEIQTGLAELTRHFIRGAATPLPPAVGFEFLRFRALNTGREDLEETALGLAAAWFSLNLDMYLKHGLPVDPNEPEGPTRKEAVVQAELLTVAAAAYQASRKEMFAKAAARLAEDLRDWSMPGHAGRAFGEGVDDRGAAEILGWIGVDPDTVIGDAASADARANVATAFALAGAGLDAQEWIDAGATILKYSNSAADEKELATRDLGLRLNSGLDAAIALGDFPGLRAAAAELIDRTRAEESVDPETPAWAALALARYGAREHDDAAKAAAAVWADRCPSRETTGQLNMTLFRAKAAEAYCLDFLARPAPMAYIVADPADPRGGALRIAALAAARPGRLISLHSPDSEGLLYPASDDGPIAYVCSGELCAPPTGKPEEVRSLLETFALPEPAGGAGFGLDGRKP